MRHRAGLGSVLVAWLATCAWGAPGTAELPGQDKESFHIPRTTSRVQLDGLSNEAAWQEAVLLPVVMQLPRFGDEPSERTEILLTYDDENLYVAGRFYDSQPQAIQATTLKRDESDESSDAFGLLIDTFNDNENGLGFVTSPTGSRLDFTITADGQFTEPNSSWNTFWDVAAVRDDRGWFAEMRIPFSSLQFQKWDGRVVMSLSAYRWIARKDERAIFPAIPQDWGENSHLKPSLARKIVLEGIRSSNPVYLRPYVLGGVGQSHRLKDAGTGFRRDDDWVREAGIDAKYSLTSNLTLDVTINTDFAQVEADDQEVNLTRYPLFFPEKRLFFLERASNFDFSFYRKNSLFHSRRIGIHQGRRVPIYGGLRLVGRIGPWDVGLLGMQSKAVANIASESFGVARVRRQVLNPSSYVGGIVTSRSGTDGSYNRAYGIDGTIRIFGDDYLKLNWAQTFANDRNNDPLSLNLAKFRAHWERYRYTGWAYGLNYSRTGAGYDPGLGFEQYRGSTSLIHFLRYGWDANDSSRFLQHRVYEDIWLHLRDTDYGVRSSVSHLGWAFTTKSGYSSHIALTHNLEDVEEELPFADDVDVPPGDYQFFNLIARFTTPTGRLLNATADAYAGAFYDGRRMSLALGSSRNFSSHLELGGEYEISRVEFPDRDQELVAHVGRGRLVVMLDVRYSVTAFLQYSSASDKVVTNVRFRYNPSEGTDVYIVYDEGLNTDRRRQEPALPRTSDRTIMLKAAVNTSWSRR
jgi:hypothetical protein